VDTRSSGPDATEVSFRRLTRSDLPTLTGWLNSPHVYEWWGTARAPGNLGGAGTDAATLAAVEAEYGPEIDGASTTQHFVIEVGRAAFGMIQWYRLADELAYAAAIGESPSGTAGIDLLIGEPTAIGHGLGPRVIDTFVRTVVFGADEVTRCVAGPEIDNRRSIRAFEKAGFRIARDAVVPGEPAPERVMVRDRNEPPAGGPER
jgi:aminoglycoside 6'-N-acetyltransferase